MIANSQETPRLFSKNGADSQTTSQRKPRTSHAAARHTTTQNRTRTPFQRATEPTTVMMLWPPQSLAQQTHSADDADRNGHIQNCRGRRSLEPPQHLEGDLLRLLGEFLDADEHDHRRILDDLDELIG